MVSLSPGTACTPIGDWIDGLDQGTSGTGGGPQDDDDDDDEEDSEDEGPSLIDELPTEEGTIELDCKLANDEDFCWYEFAQAASNCLSEPLATGRLDSARRNCSYSSGEVVEFHAALPEPGGDLDDHEWSFSVLDAKGDECLRVDDYSAQYDGWSLELRMGSKKAEITKVGRRHHIVCTNGKVYRSKDDAWLGECPHLAPKFEVFGIKKDESCSRLF